MGGEPPGEGRLEAGESIEKGEHTDGESQRPEGKGVVVVVVLMVS